MLVVNAPHSQDYWAIPQQVIVDSSLKCLSFLSVETLLML